MKPTCSVADCPSQSRARGWCPKHYERWKRYGDPLRDLSSPDLPGEVWRQAPGYEAYYEVSNKGRIRRIAEAKGTRTGRATFGHNSRGYRYFSVHAGTKKFRQTAVHRLIAEAFLGPAPSPTHQVNHKDCDPTNNTVENLEWVTPVENMRHAIAAGRLDPSNANQPRGERHRLAKLTERDVLRIRELQGILTIDEMTRLFPVTSSVISDITSRRTWRHI